jgi:hypothetical protein
LVVEGDELTVNEVDERLRSGIWDCALYQLREGKTVPGTVRYTSCAGDLVIGDRWMEWEREVMRE